MTAFKKILKKIFPLVFLKKAFQLYNSIRIRTVDRLLFPEFRLKEKDFLIYRQGYPFRENNVDISDIHDDQVRQYMHAWYQWTQEEYLLVFDNVCYVEPKIGWAIVWPNKLVYYSLGISRTPFLPKPDFFRWIGKVKAIEVPCAISLRDTGEENYFHFYNDVLAKLFFLRTHGVSIAKTPVIIAKKLWEKPYFRYYYEHSALLQSLQWIVQDREYVRCEKLICCKPLTHQPKLLAEVFHPLMITKTGQRKIFVTRTNKRMRFINNSADIENVCRKYGIEVVDCDKLSPAQQIEIFANAGFIAGIHGAGLTNI
ncbi:MAG TPA: glycosyltransferase family 61 protein, partial [Chryseosolibacter sp.]|nr:glycosyltransferase family 61 protein [Chryseosolibacter sp.]